MSKCNTNLRSILWTQPSKIFVIQIPNENNSIIIITWCTSPPIITEFVCIQTCLSRSFRHLNTILKTKFIVLTSSYYTTAAARTPNNSVSFNMTNFKKTFFVWIHASDMITTAHITVNKVYHKVLWLWAG